MSHNAKLVVDMLEDELARIVEKGDISPQDLESLKNASKTMYYLSVYCAMEDSGDDYEYSGRGRRRNSLGQYSGNRYYPDNLYRESRPRYSGDSHDEHKMEKRRMLEEMMANARTDSEREVFRNQLMELDRM